LKQNYLLQDVFSVVSATIDCTNNPFLPPAEELLNFIEHIQGADISVVSREEKLFLSGTWESLAFVRVSRLVYSL